MDGYAGRLLTVDLAGGRVGAVAVPEQTLRAVIGGSGLGAWLFLQRGRPEVEPLSPQNTLWILNGPLAGTGFPVPPGSRSAPARRSPACGENPRWAGTSARSCVRQAGTASS